MAQGRQREEGQAARPRVPPCAVSGCASEPAAESVSASASASATECWSACACGPEAFAWPGAAETGGLPAAGYHRGEGPCPDTERRPCWRPGAERPRPTSASLPRASKPDLEEAIAVLATEPVIGAERPPAALVRSDAAVGPWRDGGRPP